MYNYISVSTYLAHQSDIGGWISDLLRLVDDHVAPSVVRPNVFVSSDVLKGSDKGIGCPTKGRRVSGIQVGLVDDLKQPVSPRGFQPLGSIVQVLCGDFSLPHRVVQEARVCRGCIS